MNIKIDLLGLASLGPLLILMALLLTLGGAWLLLATRWRRQLKDHSAQPAGTRVSTARTVVTAATQRINRFFYGFGFGSLALAWLLSLLTRLL